MLVTLPKNLSLLITDNITTTVIRFQTLVVGSTKIVSLRFGVPKKGDIFQMTGGNVKREGRK